LYSQDFKALLMFKTCSGQVEPHLGLSLVVVAGGQGQIYLK